MKRSVHCLPPRKKPRGGRQKMTSPSQKSGQLSPHSLYLLAMVVTYFRRAGLRSSEYGTYMFLANQFEEDVPYQKEIYRWALRWTWIMNKDRLLQFRNVLLTRMGFRAWVDRATCDLIMAQDPEHWAWKRNRNIHHSWAIRWFRRNNALPCSLCNIVPCKKEEGVNM
ncbi:speedy protein 1-B-like [Ranitomeya variabilis]|uniref:speedy protein 1-B-like n=1 Tax=Ranitomeya variabilis TaxID=490064 RepID=UPI004055B789